METFAAVLRRHFSGRGPSALELRASVVARAGERVHGTDTEPRGPDRVHLVPGGEDTVRHHALRDLQPPDRRTFGDQLDRVRDP